MGQPLHTSVKSAIAKIMPDSARWEVICNLPKIETWRKQRVADSCPVFPRREELYDFLLANEIEGQPIDYLEFGVFRGESIAYWAAHDQNPDSRFVGFDTFTGLPEDWKKFSGGMGKHVFDCEGKAPRIDDERVSFVKGLFQDTLDDFLKTYQPRGRLVLHNDSDLYSATLYVLTRCHDLLVPGSIVVFDEFSSVLNEFKALADYCAAYCRDYDVIGVTAAYFAQVAIRFK